MSKLFTPEFCTLLDKLKSYDTVIKRSVEDSFTLLIKKGIITLEEIPTNTKFVMLEKESIRNQLKEMFDTYKNGGASNG